MLHRERCPGTAVFRARFGIYIGISAAVVQAFFAFFWIFSPQWPAALVILVLDMLVIYALEQPGRRERLRLARALATWPVFGRCASYVRERWCRRGPVRSRTGRWPSERSNHTVLVCSRWIVPQAVARPSRMCSPRPRRRAGPAGTTGQLGRRSRTSTCRIDPSTRTSTSTAVCAWITAFVTSSLTSSTAVSQSSIVVHGAIVDATK